MQNCNPRFVGLASTLSPHFFLSGVRRRKHSLSHVQNKAIFIAYARSGLLLAPSAPAIRSSARSGLLLRQTVEKGLVLKVAILHAMLSRGKSTRVAEYRSGTMDRKECVCVECFSWRTK